MATVCPSNRGGWGDTTKSSYSSVRDMLRYLSKETALLKGGRQDMIYALKAVNSGRLGNRLNIWAIEMRRYRRVWEMFKPHQSSEIQVKTTINCCFSSTTTVKVKQEGYIDTDIQGSQTNTLPEQ